MGGDLKMVNGKKRYIDDFSFGVMTFLVREKYPDAWAEGSMGTYHWWVKVDGEECEIVAEAWLHRTKPGWWLRIKDE